MYRNWQKNRKEATREERAVWLVLLCMLTLFFLYLFLLNGTIVNIAQKQERNDDFDRITGEISELQYQYITLSSELDMEYAQKLGYHKVAEPNYALRLEDRALSLAP